MLFVCFYVYWWPIRFPYHIMFVSFKSNTSFTCGAGTANLSSPQIFDGFLLLDLWFSLSLFAFLSFLFWSLYSLSLFDLLIMIIPLVSSNFILTFHPQSETAYSF
jgi:hypothetical protein